MERDLASIQTRISRLEAILGADQTSLPAHEEPFHKRLQYIQNELSAVPEEMLAAMRTVRLLSRVEPTTKYSNLQQKLSNIKPELSNLSTLITATTITAPKQPTNTQKSQLTDMRLRTARAQRSLREEEDDVNKILTMHNNSVERINVHLLRLCHSIDEHVDS